ncbi:MAG: hypothetical protein J6127_03875 [Clostridiales bacterium]|nr:hypothetical protein [Clostridiales bacterium]
MSTNVKDYLLELCCSYTIISVLGSVVNIIFGGQTNNINVLLMFCFCAIIVFVLSLHKLFDAVSPLVMMIVQYLLAWGACALVVYILSVLVEPVTPRAWFEFWRSFTIPYIIGAGYYYYRVFADAKKQNDLIAELRQKENDDTQG